ncbi:MAG: Crp/Fnr family transcriptional regulator [Betaproteobacteria bacterium]|nr:Crp/Fnr family transcriptional regulator [Betaproteobacteria bacterium]MCL2886212.1 Crp/Fnr family transcriptional regulator [Betaproteobacteria bacterium]
MSGKEWVDLQGFLGAIEPYSVLDARALSRLAAAARVIRLERGQSLFEQGQSCVGVHVVVSGQFKLAFSSPHGAEKVITIVTDRESMGETCLSLGQHYPFHAEALRDSQLVFLPKLALSECLQANPEFLYRQMQCIAHKLHILLQEVEASALLSGAERILAFLMQAVNSTEADGSAKVELSLPKSIIASRLSLTQEHFSRLLRQLSESGMITVAGRTVHIPNPDRVNRYLDSGAAHGQYRGGRSTGRGRADWGRLATA